MASSSSAPQRRTFTAPSGHSYAYSYSPPQAATTTTVLLLHGFPGSSQDWTSQVQALAQDGYGVICPDLLGYGDSSKPTDVAAYRLRGMVDEVVALVNAEEPNRVVGIGHDWGATLLSRIANYYPNVIAAYVFLAVGYTPSGPFDPDMMNKLTLEHLGYTGFGYIDFFVKDSEAAALMERSADVTTSWLFAAAPDHWKHHVCPIGAGKAWLEAGKTAPLPDWMSSEKRSAMASMCQKGGCIGPVNWYRQAAHKTMNPTDEASISEQNKRIDTKPVLFLSSGTDDTGMPAEMQEGMMTPHIGNLRIERLDAGHWMLLEKPSEVNKHILSFLSSIGKTD